MSANKSIYVPLDEIVGAGLGLFAVIALFRLLHERYGYNDAWSETFKERLKR